LETESDDSDEKQGRQDFHARDSTHLFAAKEPSSTLCKPAALLGDSVVVSQELGPSRLRDHGSISGLIFQGDIQGDIGGDIWVDL